MRPIYYFWSRASYLLCTPINAQVCIEPNFELTNALSNTTIYYSIGNSDDPCNYAENYPLIPLEPDKSTCARLTSKQPELLISWYKPENIPIAALLSKFTPDKTMFVQTKLSFDRVIIVPQTGKYLGFGQSKTGRDLSNNVTQKDITSKLIGYAPKSTYTKSKDCVPKT